MLPRPSRRRCRRRARCRSPPRPWPPRYLRRSRPRPIRPRLRSVFLARPYLRLLLLRPMPAPEREAIKTGLLGLAGLAALAAVVAYAVIAPGSAGFRSQRVNGPAAAVDEN